MWRIVEKLNSHEMQLCYTTQKFKIKTYVCCFLWKTLWFLLALEKLPNNSCLCYHEVFYLGHTKIINVLPNNLLWVGSFSFKLILIYFFGVRGKQNASIICSMYASWNAPTSLPQLNCLVWVISPIYMVLHYTHENIYI